MAHGFCLLLTLLKKRIMPYTTHAQHVTLSGLPDIISETSMNFAIKMWGFYHKCQKMNLLCESEVDRAKASEDNDLPDRPISRFRKTALEVFFLKCLLSELP